MGKNKKVKTPELSKEEFLEFLSSATPQELNALISNKGKERKLYNPFYQFRNTEEIQEEKQIGG